MRAGRGTQRRFGDAAITRSRQQRCGRIRDRVDKDV